MRISQMLCIQRTPIHEAYLLGSSRDSFKVQTFNYNQWLTLHQITDYLRRFYFLSVRFLLQIRGDGN